MDLEEERCKNCGLNSFELIDGHHYCTECHEQLDEVAQKEYDEYGHENVLLDKKGTRKKLPQKSKQDHEATMQQITSYEEYNFILYGLVNEILQIENIPNFKVTVLQLWIHYLKKYEVAFFESDNINHLPKLNCVYRERDAQILYNKKPKKRKKKSYYKKKVHTLDELEAKTKEGTILRRKLVKKSIKKIAKKQMEVDTQSSYTSTLSTLSNLTLNDITSAHNEVELAIEFSQEGKETKKKVLKRYEELGKPIENNESGEPKIAPRHLWLDETLQILRGTTLFSIIYTALNICESKIQVGDLIKLCNNGYISYFNFKKFLPESTEKSKLSLDQFGGLRPLNSVFCRDFLYKYYLAFPDVKFSIKTPDLMMLVNRYVSDLNLPNAIADYVERFMKLLPSRMNIFPYLWTPNYEGRAMGYILFVIKYIFGIDGYREKEMSDSARKINFELKRLGINQKLFVYEDWRESIEYRDTILCKYYYPTISRKTEFKADKPYINYLKKLKSVKQTMRISKNKNKKGMKEAEVKKEFLRSILNKLKKFHEDDPVNSRDKFHFDWSFTPLKDAFELIIQDDEIKPTINRRVAANYEQTICDYYLNSEPLVKLFNEHGIMMKVKKCTFPKTFTFQQLQIEIENVNRNEYNQKVTKVDFNVNVDEETWKKNFKEVVESRARLQEEKKVKYHNKQMNKMIKKRLKYQKLFSEHNQVHGEPETDEIIDDLDENDEEEMSDDESLIFVKSDFNLWHRMMKIVESHLTTRTYEFDKFPKSFLWLLETSSNTINQRIEEVYYQLMLIESQMVDRYEPLELSDYNLVPRSRTNKYIESFD